MIITRNVASPVGGNVTARLTLCRLPPEALTPHAGNMPKEPSSFPTPTISRVLPDGTMIELLYDADASTTALAICPPSGTPTIKSRIDLTDHESLVP